MENKLGFFDADMEAIVSVLRREPRVEKAIIFGSRAKGSFRKATM